MQPIHGPRHAAYRKMRGLLCARGHQIERRGSLRRAFLSNNQRISPIHCQLVIDDPRGRICSVAVDLQAGAGDIARKLVAVTSTLGPVGLCRLRKVGQGLAPAVNESVVSSVPGKCHRTVIVEFAPVITAGIVAKSGVIRVELADAVAVHKAYQQTAVDVRASTGYLKIIVRWVSGSAVAAIEVILRERRIWQRISWACSGRCR